MKAVLGRRAANHSMKGSDAVFAPLSEHNLASGQVRRVFGIWNSNEVELNRSFMKLVVDLLSKKRELFPVL